MIECVTEKTEEVDNDTVSFTPLTLQDRKAVNEHCCLGNAGLCNQEARLFLEAEGKKDDALASPSFSPSALYWQELSHQSQGF